MTRRVSVLMFLTVISLFAGSHKVMAEEGMWVPLFLNRNVADMQEKGCRLSVEDIYAVNGSSLKDAVVIFGGGCTGEVVSSEGLLFTNHHCGYSQIQSHSSVENDYLTNGFWARSREEELPNRDLSVKFLVRIADVTDSVMQGVVDTMSLDARSAQIENNIDSIVSKAVYCETLSAVVEPFYGGNQYLLYLYEVFEDVRLVGAPPSAIGKFGGDTDNWMWPRHTGDFSVFRIYADSLNRPAKYSPTNVPYCPKRFLQINAGGLAENDFTMVLGFPGSTNLYASSSYIKTLMEEIYPKYIEMRTAKLDVMNRHQERDDKIRIQYAAKNASTSNAWKKWQGEIKGLKRSGALSRKQRFESDFVSRGGDASIIDDYRRIYDSSSDSSVWTVGSYAEAEVSWRMYLELVNYGGMETMSVARRMQSFMDKKITSKTQDKMVEWLKSDFYKNYSPVLDREMSAAVLRIYCKYVPQELLPPDLRKMSRLPNADYLSFVDNLFKGSIFDDASRMLSVVERWSDRSAKMIKKDALYKFYLELHKAIGRYGAYFDCRINGEEIDTYEEYLKRRYLSEILAMDSVRVLPSDANFTMRLTYGKVGGYRASDAVEYNYFTTLEGVIEKNNPDIYDYRVPQRLIELYEAKDYGPYADADGTMHVCFVASNHTTGGNSGSPILDSEGRLVGLNFDRAWDGVMSDMVYDVDICRNISLDVRYMLFIIDKFAGAGYLLDELDIVY